MPTVGSSKPWLDADGQFLFGKHRRSQVDTVCRDDPSYIRWLLETVDDMTTDDYEIISSSYRLRR